MDDMTAATKRTNSDGALKINHHTEHQVVTAARRRRMELMRLKVIANSGSQNAEPVTGYVIILNNDRQWFGDQRGGGAGGGIINSNFQHKHHNQGPPGWF